MVENRAQNLKGFPWRRKYKIRHQRNEGTRKTKTLPQLPVKKRILTPAVQAIPAGYEEDDRIVKELKRDGLPLTAENKELYKELDEEIQEGKEIREIREGKNSCWIMLKRFSREIASPQRLATLGTIAGNGKVHNPKEWYCSESIYDMKSPLLLQRQTRHLVFNCWRTTDILLVGPGVPCRIDCIPSLS